MDLEDVENCPVLTQIKFSLEIVGSCILQAIEETDYPTCFKWSVLKSASMVWGYVGAFVMNCLLKSS